MDEDLTLSGIRVLDLGHRPSTAWCGRLLADFGAEVIGVEGDGHPLRQEGPFTDAGESVPAAYMLAGRSLANLDALPTLIANAHIILTSERDPSSAAVRLLTMNPNAIVCAITAYGIDGAMAGTDGNDLTACATGGWAHVNGLVGREPLKCSGYGASYQAGTFAFSAILAALIEQLAGKHPGQIIDVSEREVLVSTSAPAPLRFQYSGFKWARKPAVDVNEGPVPVNDGWFALTLSRPAFWIKAMELLGLQDLARDPELQQAGLRHKLKDRFVDRVGAAMKTWNRMDLFDALGERRVIAGPVLRMDELSANPQFEARGFLREASGGIRFPGPFAAMSKSGWRVPGSRQTRNAFSSNGEVTTTPRRNSEGSVGPLAGFRGLVLTQAWAGTYCTELLALMGADVIQLETRGRLDSWRGTYQNPIPKSLAGRPTARHAWNCSPLYNSVNLGKRCITVDLSDPEGVEIFQGLVQHADFVVENFSPRVMRNLGIDYTALCEIKPDLVFASLSAYGATGPWSHVPGIGGTIEPSSGMSALLGYEGEHPMNSGQMYPDPVAGLCGLSAILVALLHRDRAGEGQYIDLSMQEANFVFVGDAWLEYELTGNVRGPLGNTHPGQAPHGIFPAAGEDQWIAISVRSDQEWLTLAGILDIDASSRFAALADRLEQCDSLNELVSHATVPFDKFRLARTLQHAGIVSAPVLAPDEIAADTDLRARGHMQEIVHPEAGPAYQSTLPARFSRSALPAPAPAPMQGQHSFDVFETFLGMDRERYEALCERGISGKGPSGKASVANQA